MAIRLLLGPANRTDDWMFDVLPLMYRAICREDFSVRFQRSYDFPVFCNHRAAYWCVRPDAVVKHNVRQFVRLAEIEENFACGQIKTGPPIRKPQF